MEPDREEVTPICTNDALRHPLWITLLEAVTPTFRVLRIPTLDLIPTQQEDCRRRAVGATTIVALLRRLFPLRTGAGDTEGVWAVLAHLPEGPH